MTLPAAGWQVGKGYEADLVLEAVERHAVIAAHATCGGVPSSRALPILARHLRFGVRDVTVVDRNDVTLSGRAALRTRFRGTLDVKSVEIEHYVTKAGPCVHDLIYVALPENFREGQEGFVRFAGSFVADGGR